MIPVIAIFGGTGTVGRELVRELLDAEASFRMISRDRARAEVLVKGKAEVVEANMNRPATLIDALTGIDKAFLLASPGPTQLRQESNAIQACDAAGVEHIVKLSVIGASCFSDISFVRAHWESERRIENTRMAYTFLQPNWFMQNLLGHAESIAATGILRSPNKAGLVSMIDVRDIAAVAARCLLTDGHRGFTYVLTGPEALSMDEVARIFSKTLSREITCMELDADATRNVLISAGLDKARAQDMMRLTEFLRQGYGQARTPTVRRVSGKAPYSFLDFAQAYADAFQPAKMHA